MTPEELQAIHDYIVLPVGSVAFSDIHDMSFFSNKTYYGCFNCDFIKCSVSVLYKNGYYSNISADK